MDISALSLTWDMVEQDNGIYNLQIPMIPPVKFNIAPENVPKKKIVFQPSFFRGYVKLRGCIGDGCFKEIVLVVSFVFSCGGIDMIYGWVINDCV